MHSSESVTVDARPAVVFPYVADLAEYPRWMHLVHRAERLSVDDGPPAWSVEIRAQVGPFARSKRLRMERVECIEEQLVVFERSETDGRDHAGWHLRVELAPAPPDAHRARAGEQVDEHVDVATTVTMHLAYDGRLWTGGVLNKVLDDQIRRGRLGLIELVSAETKR